MANPQREKPQRPRTPRDVNINPLGGGMGKKVCVMANGCPENRIEAARIEEFLKANGWKITKNYKQSDCVIFIACGLTNDREEYSNYVINKISSNNNRTIFVGGCLPRIKEDLKGKFSNIIVLKDSEFEKIDGTNQFTVNFNNVHSNHLISRSFLYRWYWNHLIKSFDRYFILELFTRFYVYRLSQKLNIADKNIYSIKISNGCLGNCAYCGIKIARGRVNSKPVEYVLREFEEGLKKGYRKFALLGTDIGVYGRDNRTTLVALLEEMVKREGEYTIMLRNFNARFLIEMFPFLHKIFETGRISFLSSAVQSGNNRILTRMKRGYRIENYKGIIKTIKRDFPDIILWTQVMVGFPGETQEEYDDTLKLLDELPLDFVEIYPFQPRPGTEAAQMEDQINEKEIMRRYYKIYRKLIVKKIFSKKNYGYSPI